MQSLRMNTSASVIFKLLLSIALVINIIYFTNSLLALFIYLL